MVTRDQIAQWLGAAAAVIEAHRDHLTQLDAAIGDADHGINMDRGFKKVAEQLPALVERDIGTMLKGAGMALVSSVGGASGPLYGTMFMRAGAAVQGKNELDAAHMAALLQAALQGVVERGRTECGDKTMVDALAPAAESFAAAVEAGDDARAALERAVAAAALGVQDTIPMQARKGRASYLGERSVGHADPGATSTHLILTALLDVLS